ncbi:M15 family metallopeptidase [Pseudonocardia eucalypti]|uniref:M15 family metallopeptidase n=1 Tax=Pseudonocardia eucalypti TaxID=648755 RepID=A0ABP9PH85_9PSEU|nr:hypothetical protein [Pseudonocardia eucalypti]
MRSLVLAVAVLAATGCATTPANPANAREPGHDGAIQPVTAERLGASWRPGCPLAPERLRLVRVPYLGFDGTERVGELVVAEEVAGEIVTIFERLRADRYPIERMETVDHYGADDDRSMAANNTSAFNCRPKTGGGGWSNHSFGRAIDINPVQNPYIGRTGSVLPPAGEPFKDRNRTDRGVIHAGDRTVAAFTDHGWGWGGSWQSPIDYQHFEKP